MQRKKKVCAIIVQVFIRVRNVPRLSDTFSGALHEANNANDMTRFPQNGGH